MGTITVTGLNVLAIYVSDIESAKLFYTEHLGFESCGDHPPGILMQAGDVTLYIEGGCQRQASPDAEAVTISPCFACESVKDAFGHSGQRRSRLYRSIGSSHQRTRHSRSQIPMAT